MVIFLSYFLCNYLRNINCGQNRRVVKGWTGGRGGQITFHGK